MGDDVITVEIREIRPFLQQVFAGNREQAEWVDDRGLNAEVFRALLDLARTADPDLEVGEDGHTVQGSELRVVVGKRFHVKVRSAAWQLVLGILPAIVSGVMLTSTPADAAAVLGTAITAAVANTKRLDRDELRLYGLIAESNGISRSDLIIAAKKHGIARAEASRLIERMIAAGVVEESDGTLTIVT
jgi:polysaccharide pyruvyl transferase WcaK-like protein